MMSDMPEPSMKGRFTLYDTPDGGKHIAYQADGSEETGHIEIPAMVIKTLEMVGSGKLSPAKAFKAMASMRGKAPSEPA